MSSKTKKAAAARMGGRTTAPVSKAARSGARIYASSVQAAQAAPANRRAVQITAGVVAALCLIGGIAAALVTGANYTTPVIVELVLLGIITAVAVFVVLKPDAVINWVRKLR